MPQTHPWALRKGNKVRALERVRALFQPSLGLKLLRLIAEPLGEALIREFELCPSRVLPFWVEETVQCEVGLCPSRDVPFWKRYVAPASIEFEPWWAAPEGCRPVTRARLSHPSIGLSIGS